ncbi:MAG: hypothetical protein WD030_01355, partial [Pirellulales bacterium]
TIVLFCNNPAAFSPTYRRYLLNVFRDNLPFAEVPIKLYLRRRESSEGGSTDDKIDRTESGQRPVEPLNEPRDAEYLASVLQQDETAGAASDLDRDSDDLPMP